MLESPGKISHASAMNKAHEEYKAYRTRIDKDKTAVDIAFYESVKSLQKKVKESKIE